MSNYHRVVVCLPAEVQFVMLVSKDGTGPVEVHESAVIPSQVVPLDSRWAESAESYSGMPDPPWFESAAERATAWLDTHDWPSVIRVSSSGVTVPPLDE